MFAILVSAWALAKTQIPDVMFLFYLWDGPDWKNSQKFWKFNSSSSWVIEYWQHELTFALEERQILSKFSSFLLVLWHQTSQLTLLLQKRKVVWWNKTSPWSRVFDADRCISYCRWCGACISRITVFARCCCCWCCCCCCCCCLDGSCKNKQSLLASIKPSLETAYRD